MKIKVFSLFLWVLSEYALSTDTKIFDNVVRYPLKSSVYRYTLEITNGLSMSIWNEKRKTYDPVLQSYDKFYLRNYSYAAKCGDRSLITDSAEINSIITLGGIHREMLLINKQFPGTPIIIPKNAKVEITVINKLMSESVSLHWHGQTQKNTFYMDGVSRVTQCPIGPGEKFTYKFTANDEGTHW